MMNMNKFSNLLVIGRSCSSCNFFFLVSVSILASRISSMEISQCWSVLALADAGAKMVNAGWQQQ